MEKKDSREELKTGKYQYFHDHSLAFRLYL